MNQIKILLSGATSGIGKALAKKLLENGFELVLISRHAMQLMNTFCNDRHKIICFNVDLSSKTERQSLIKKLQSYQFSYIIHNAGVEAPLTPLKNLSCDDMEKAFQLNFFTPFKLTQSLIPNLTDNARVLFVSTGAAHKPKPGLLAYGASKAAQYFFWKYLQLEHFDNKKIWFGSVRPGVVDTPMQARLRSLENSVIETRDFFALIQDKLISPEAAADFIFKLLMNTEPAEFISKEWDIRDDRL